MDEKELTFLNIITLYFKEELKSINIIEYTLLLIQVEMHDIM